MCPFDGLDLLAEPEICRAYCAGWGAGAETFTCAAEAADCVSAVTCVAPPPDEVDELPTCDAIAPRLAACYAERCPSMAATEADAAGWFTLVCNDRINAYREDEAELMAAISADTPCDDVNIAFLLDHLTGGDRLLTIDGTLAESCEAGPLVDAETCASACEAFRGCVPETSPFHLEGVCPFVCASFEQRAGPQVWPCVAAAAGQECSEINACFSLAP